MKIDNIEVIDANVDDEFEVTQDDANNGVPRDHHACSIALGWKRFDPLAQDVIVGKSRAYKLKEYFGYLKWFRYGVSQPIKVQEAILDNGGRFSPGIYTLKVLPKSKKTGVQQGSDTRPEQPKPKPTLVKTTRVHTDMRTNMPTQST
jgi:hypothetical protein